MVSDRFAVRYTVRLALFALTVLVSAWLALETAYPFTAILLGGAAVLQGWFLIRSVERHAGEVGRFFDSVRSGDFTGSFPPPSGDRVFDGLHTALNEALERFRASRAECEDRYITFRTVVEHAGIGLAAFRSGGGVVISNAPPAAFSTRPVSPASLISEVPVPLPPKPFSGSVRASARW